MSTADEDKGAPVSAADAVAELQQKLGPKGVTVVQGKPKSKETRKMETTSNTAPAAKTKTPRARKPAAPKAQKAPKAPRARKSKAAKTEAPAPASPPAPAPAAITAPPPAAAAPATKPKPTSAPVPAPKVEPKSEANDLLADILGGAKLEGSAVAAAITTANSILDSKEATRKFLGIMEAVDKLGEFHFRGNDGKRRWQALGYGEVKAELQKWADAGDKPAVTALGELAKFERSQVSVVGPLWDVLVDIVRPANEVQSYRALRRLMDGLVQKGVAVISPSYRSFPGTGVVLRKEEAPKKEGEGGYICFEPAKEGHGKDKKDVPMARAGWQYLVNAKSRLKAAAKVPHRN